MNWASDDAKLQLAELVSAFPQAERMREDFSLYDIPCVTPEGERVKLRVALPMAFPRVKPVLTVTGSVGRHANVDAAGRMSFASLERWSFPQSRLVEVAAEAVTLLTGRDPLLPQSGAQQGAWAGARPGAAPSPSRPPPPPIFGDCKPVPAQASQAPAPAPSRPPMPFYGLDGEVSAGDVHVDSGPHADAIRPGGPATGMAPAVPRSDVRPPPPAPLGQLPPVPTEFPELAGKTHQELMELLRDPEKLASLTSVVVERMDLDRAVREVEARNRALAEDIMVKQEAAKGAAVHINIVRANDFAAARAELESLAARQAAVWDRVDPEKHLRELGDRRKALDEQARGMASAVESGAAPVTDEWLRDYIALRVESHSAELITQLAMRPSRGR